MTMNLNKAYLAMQEASGIKVGDTVRVLRKAADGEMGWNNEWDDDEMDGYVGREWQVTEVYGDCGVLLNRGCYFPFFVLEKIKGAPRFIEINGNKVPEPERKALERGEVYWTPDLAHGASLPRRWRGVPLNNRHLGLGMVHKTKEAAEIHAKALLSFTSTEG